MYLQPGCDGSEVWGLGTPLNNHKIPQVVVWRVPLSLLSEKKLPGGGLRGSSPWPLAKRTKPFCRFLSMLNGRVCMMLIIFLYFYLMPEEWHAFTNHLLTYVMIGYFERYPLLG